jgi:hypothetical protein
MMKLSALKLFFTYPFLVFRSLIPSSTITDLHTFLSLSFLPVCSKMMAVLLLPMFSPTVEKQKGSYTLLEISHFYDLNPPPPRNLVTNRILRDARTELFKTHTTGNAPEKPGRIRTLSTSHMFEIRLMATHLASKKQPLKPNWIIMTPKSLQSLNTLLSHKL